MSMGFALQRASPFESVLVAAPEDTLRFVTQLPDFEAQDINGRVWRSADVRGKFTLIDIWATFCGPCRRDRFP